MTPQNQTLLVRQYRPSVEEYTVELPSGHVEDGELPAQAAQRELVEETGYKAHCVELLGCILPDTGRLANRMWCFFGLGATPCCPVQEPEEGINLILCDESDLIAHVNSARFDHALHLAAILLALAKDKFSFRITTPS